MEILINGQPGLAETDNDVSVGELIAYLRQELGRQRLVARAFRLDGKDVDIENDPAQAEYRTKTPSEYQRLEIEVASVEIVAHDVVAELADKAPLLADDAIDITQKIQTGRAAEARDKLIQFLDATSYVTQALTSVTRLVKLPPERLLVDGKDLNVFLDGLLGHLRGLGESLKDNDYATVGDIVEFDVAPAVRSLAALLADVRVLLAEIVAAMQDEGEDS